MLQNTRKNIQFVMSPRAQTRRALVPGGDRLAPTEPKARPKVQVLLCNLLQIRNYRSPGIGAGAFDGLKKVELTPHSASGS